MEILVLSDSHGRADNACRVLEREKDCKTVFFLGDGEREALLLKEKYKDRSFICVRGNNDYASSFEDVAYKHIYGVTIMACHGHTYDVRFSRRTLFYRAADVRAHLALYGHTHVPLTEGDPLSGVCAVNPGALCNGNYCVISIEKGKYDIFHKTL